MEANYYGGIDISKQQLDWQVNDSQNQPLINGRAVNRPGGIGTLIAQWERQGIPLDELVLCFEHTGPYGLLLVAMLEQAGVRYVMVSAVGVQRSLGIRRGKSDRIDAARLAEYGWRFRDRLSPSRLPSKQLLQLLTEQIQQVDRTIGKLLRAYNTQRGQYELLVSIPGIGPVIAGWLLVYTEGFTRFENARQLACFAGSAPFPHQSGEQKSPDRVSRWRCVRLKTLLLNGMHAAIQHDPELRAYYRRKCGEGKHPQSVRNAVICKLLYRAFAVIGRGTPYVKLHQHEATKIT